MLELLVKETYSEILIINLDIDKILAILNFQVSTKIF